MNLKLSHLSHTFDTHSYILKEINFQDSFQSLAIIGPSGGGKSTLLRILGGLIYPTNGTFFLDNQKMDFTDASFKEWRKLISFVFQINGLFPHLTALENIILPLEHVFQLSKEESIETAYTFLKRFNLEKEANKYPYELSGGQSQRISIARAVASKPKLLLLDEPTSALDPELTNEVLEMIQELLLEKINIILVTHHMGFAKHACEKVMFLIDGSIEESGSSKTLFNSPKSTKLQSFLNKILEWS